ncbi:MAG: PQQ-dependent dehydrogenase, methanol/ethanol family [SAR86 cluster bacterium]|uniref:PQQ-dependent dehydrogenase, methanol/ethanol family n=1 Tax=SAR86 cluster bacterium TaxID=2030880 RepID=A0A2A4X3Z6_9GAMM|nr:MAG: PQQ-dependent dehydrogenase, methanol/ethanol family [SAR86 cluster bacterium]
MKLSAISITKLFFAFFLSCLGGSPVLADTSFETLLEDEANGADWLSYSGGYKSQRFSPLSQINTLNVDQLKVMWAYQMQPTGISGAALQETTPLVAGDVMYITESPSSVTALDTHTGRMLWHFVPDITNDVLNIGFPRINRGVALLDDKVYVATLDARLFALDAATGAVRWETTVADNSVGFSLTLAPLALDGKIVVGVSGAEAGVRGYIDAYDSVTGERLWRTYTVPAPGEPGSETWQGDDWQTGGGSTWLTGSYDPELDLLYWTTGNPAPDWNGDLRPGDNLFTCAVLALDPDTGEMKWFFQYTPHDTHDWDANQIPVLVDGEFEGQERKLLALANRNAFYYLLDRETGEYLLGEEYSFQTWAEGIDDNGRPIVIPNSEPMREGNLVWPSLQGATNWFSPSYNPQTEQLFVPNRRMGAIYFKSDVEYEPGMPFLGGGEQPLDGDDASGAILALDVMTGEQQWEFELQTPPWSGVMATAGGLVFGSSNEGNFFALDAEDGDPLWFFNSGAHIRTNPMGFSVGGNQRVAIIGGQTLFVFGLE